ncbi:Imm49 family immunity protein [Myxococcus sp. CA039A]|uniref:Imm49 family immunity protein n=1 Tax=Myxococcus sp. CA039A TaxID=2741737 RepID=UPI00157A6599|nr:Imm49 family immunity protein [Myxococcus sp. CA039A]NTX53274.1 immunity 49 family protein [Myxococcus sp. CA039A]
MSLHAQQQDIMEELQEQLATIAGGAPAVELGRVYEEVEQCFQATACCALLVAADRASFQKHLCWAALARRDYLRRIRDEGPPNDFRCARGRSEAFFCAVAAGDIALAVEIGDLSPSVWIPDGEYEDDFAYQCFLHQCLKRADPVVRGTVLRRFEAAVKDSHSSRFDVCTALQQGSREDFESALEAVIDGHCLEQDDLRPHSEDVSTFEPRSRVFIEGLALLRIASTQGLHSTARTFRRCPWSVREYALEGRPDDIFAEMTKLSGTRRPTRRGSSPA